MHIFWNNILHLIKEQKFTFKIKNLLIKMNGILVNLGNLNKIRPHLLFLGYQIFLEKLYLTAWKKRWKGEGVPKSMLNVPRKNYKSAGVDI